MCVFPWRPEEGLGYPGAEVAGSWESPNKGTGI